MPGRHRRRRAVRDGVERDGRRRPCCGAARRPRCSRPTTASSDCSPGRRPGADRIAAARRLAADTRSVVLLKGPTTVVAEPDGDVLVVVAGDARLATAGTGDVLSGIIGALLATGHDAVRRGRPQRRGSTAARRSRGRASGSSPGDLARCAAGRVARTSVMSSLARPLGVGGGRSRRRRPQRRGAARTPSPRPRCAPWSRPTATGTAPSPWRRPRSAPVRPGCASRSTGEGVDAAPAGIDGPILVLSEQPVDDAARPSPTTRLTPTVATHGDDRRPRRRCVDRRPRRAPQDRHRDAPRGRRTRPTRPRSSSASPATPAWLRLDGVFTHLAVADEPDDPYTAEQLGALRRRPRGDLPTRIARWCTRRQLGRRARPSRGAPHAGAGRHRCLRHLARPGVDALVR